MNIRYQNNQTGAAHDITNLITEAKWATKRVGSPAKLELTACNDPAVEWTEGGIVSYQDVGMGLFYGYVFKISQSEAETTAIIAYDQTRYLKNKETYKFEGHRADEVLAKIAADFQLKIGALPNTGYVIPSMLEDAQSLFDIALKALDLTLINAGRMFCLWDDYGSLRLSEVKPSDTVPIIGEGSLATGYSYERSIDGETYNKIKLVRDNKETGKRDAYIAYDSNNMQFWGVLQNYEKADEQLNDAQMKERVQMMLELYNRPQRTLSLPTMAIPGLRAGQMIYAQLPKIGVGQTFLIEEASHDLMKKTMDLKVKVV